MNADAFVERARAIRGTAELLIEMVGFSVAEAATSAADATGVERWRTARCAGAMAFYAGLFGWQPGAGEVGFPYQFLKRPGADRNAAFALFQPT